MPIHDWTRVNAGTWNDFHLGWVVEIQRVLNQELLSSDYYAQAAQLADPTRFNTTDLAIANSATGMRDAVEAESIYYILKRRTIVIRHSSGDRIVALLEIVSPGKKSSGHAMRSFVEKAVEALYRGYHLLIIDLFPPGQRDPNGIHAAIWGEFDDNPTPLPPDEPLTLASYSAGPTKRAYVEPTAVGRELIDVPLFLTPEVYVNVPLEATYQAGYRGVPRRWRVVLDDT